MRSVPLAELMGLFAVCLFAFSAWLSPQQVLANTTLKLLLVAFILDFPRVISVAHRAPLLWITVVCIAYIELRTAIAVAHQPALTAIHQLDGERLLKLMYFPIIAWFIAGKQDRILAVFAIALLGFIVGRLFHFSLPFGEHANPFWRGQDPMGIPTAIPLALYAATAGLGLMVLGPRLWRRVSFSAWRWPVSGAWALLVLFTGAIVLIAQSRTVWFALTVVILGTFAVLWKELIRRTTPLKFSLYLGVIGIVALVACSLFSCENIRLFEETETYISLLHGDIKAISPTTEQGHVRSVGLRIHMLLFGIDQWLAEPFFGRGPGATQPLMWAYGADAYQDFGDLHNGYVEILLRLGLVGGLLFALIIIVAIRNAWQARRDGRLNRDVLVFLVMAMSLALLVNLTNFRLLNWDERFFWLLIGGTLATFSIPHPPKSALSLDGILAWLLNRFTRSKPDSRAASHTRHPADQGPE